MRKGLIAIILALSVLVMACSTAQQPTVQCNAPYKTIGTTCCLDDNNNNICDDKEQVVVTTKDACQTDADCEVNTCIGCVNKAWFDAMAVKPMCDRQDLQNIECGCVQNKCSQLEKKVVESTKVTAGNKIRFGADKLPITLEMQAGTKILFTTEVNEGLTGVKEVDEVYTLDTIQENQINIFHEMDNIKVKKGNSAKIGPLTFIFSGVNPPKNGNYAIIKVTQEA